MNVESGRIHIGAAALASLRIDVHPALLDRLALHFDPVITEYLHGIERDLLAGFDIEGPVQ